jgi:large subunit ribosomal protein L23
MAKPILVKPLITEKAETLSEGLNKYSFVVAKGANKVEIRKAVQDMYGVNVTSVNTAIMPGKAKNRTTKSGVLKGRVAAYKKAIITLVEGEDIDFFGDI